MSSEQATKQNTSPAIPTLEELAETVVDDDLFAELDIPILTNTVKPAPSIPAND